VLKAAAGGDSPRAPLTVLRFSGNAQGGALDADRASELAVSVTVGEILRLLGAGLQLDDAPVQPSDVAVLVDSHRQGSLVKRALGAVGVGAVEISRERVVATLQAEELARWLAAVAEPADAGLLRAALLAAPAGLDAAALDSLASDPAGWNAWVEHFAACRETWSQHGPQAALRRLLFGTGAAGRLAALRDGERRLTNLLHLFELIAESDEASQGPRQAWRWLARARAGDGQAGEAFELRLDSDENLVRILTVHKSKGLEFPFVFLPFAWQGRGAKAEAPFVHHLGPGSLSGEAGHWQPVLELSDRPDGGAVAQRLVEVEAESVRRLYVALTRAEQRCFVLWGPAAAAASTPLAGRLAELAGLSPDSDAASDPAALARAADAWREAAGPGSVAVVDVGDAAEPAEVDGGSAGGQAVAAIAAAEAQAPLQAPQARPFAARIPAPWIRTSFSALAQRIAEGEPADEAWGPQDDDRPDHDQRDAGVVVTTGDIRFSFPAGARAGSCLHGVLEHCAFDAPLDRRLVAAQLVRAGFAASLSTGVAGWLDAVLDTDLRAPDSRTVSLRGVAPDSAVREMDFLLPGEGVDDRALLEAVASEYPVDAWVASSRWSGFLRGFIDLVFEQDGRWYVLDWKSNRLGGQLDDYRPPAIEAAMREHAYSVQACLYLLVLHRFLRLRVPGYDWDRDIGGAFWVFLRGVRSGQAGGPTPGVHASKPSRSLIERLDRLFEGGRP
jgi:exodeoxyribonuclease V beta subunit